MRKFLNYGLLIILLFAVIKFVGINNEATPTANSSSGTLVSDMHATSRMQASGISYVDFFKKPTITAYGALVENLETGTIVFDLNTDARWPIASITKLMTALITRELIGNSELVSISRDVVATEGGAGDLRVGEIYSSLDLIKAMLLVSSNDAAEGLAQFFGREKFIAAMNMKARELGMQNTSFFDPTGLLVTNQSSIDDLLILTRYILAKHKDIFKITRYPELVITDTVHKRANALRNINALVLDKDWTGGKTGFIDESGGNLLSLFGNYLVVVLGSDDRFSDTLKLWEWTKKVYASSSGN